jgi:hypothetical protein
MVGAEEPPIMAPAMVAQPELKTASTSPKTKDERNGFFITVGILVLSQFHQTIGLLK